MAIEQDALRHAQAINNGLLLAIDPASGGTSQPGWAAWRNGKLLRSGTIDLPRKALIQERLNALFHTVEQSQPDVLVIERIRGSMAHEHLHWAVGVCVGATCAPVLIEMPVSTWKAHAGPDHIKSDENDAIAIGNCLLHLASGQPLPTKKKKATSSGKPAR